MNRTPFFYEVMRLVPNLQQAYYSQGNEPLPRSMLENIPPPRVITRNKVEKKCKECQKFKLVDSRAHFCSKTCRDRYNVRKHYKRMQENPAKYQDLKEARNRKLLDFYTKVDHGFISGATPPSIVGRPSRIRSMKVAEYRRSISLLRSKRNEI